MGIRVTKRGKDLPLPEAVTDNTGAVLPDVNGEIAATAELLHLAALEAARRGDAPASELHGRDGFVWRADMGAVERTLWPDMISGPGTPGTVQTARRTLRTYLKKTGNMECLKMTGAGGDWWIAAEWGDAPADAPAAELTTFTETTPPAPVVDILTRLGTHSTAPELLTAALETGWHGSSWTLRNAVLRELDAGTVTKAVVPNGSYGRNPAVYGLPGWPDPQPRTVAADAGTPRDPVIVTDVTASELLQDITAVLDGTRGHHLRDILRGITAAHPGRYKGWTMIQLGRALREAGVPVIQVWAGNSNRNGIMPEAVERAVKAVKEAPVIEETPAPPAVRPAPVRTPFPRGTTIMPMRAAADSVQGEILAELRAIRKLLEERS